MHALDVLLLVYKCHYRTHQTTHNRQTTRVVLSTDMSQPRFRNNSPYFITRSSRTTDIQLTNELCIFSRDTRADGYGFRRHSVIPLVLANVGRPYYINLHAIAYNCIQLHTIFDSPLTTLINNDQIIH